MVQTTDPIYQAVPGMRPCQFCHQALRAPPRTLYNEFSKEMPSKHTYQAVNTCA
jgi:hypothetical protein